MLETLKKYMCSNCKGNCKKELVIEEGETLKAVRCLDYVRAEQQEGYKKHKITTAKQHRPIFKGFRQEL